MTTFLTIVGIITVLGYIMFYYKTRYLMFYEMDQLRLTDLVFFIPIVGEIVFLLALKYGTS